MGTTTSKHPRAKHPQAKPPCGLARPKRNRYFYGKLLDAYHFELETDYHSGKRHLLNRLVSGYGVVCGLDVTKAPCPDPDNGDPGGKEGCVVVSPGFAIDPWGREIVVDQESPPIPIPPALASDKPGEVDTSLCCYDCHSPEDEHWAHLVLCYHECETEPTPALSGDCGQDACQAGAVVERYRLEFRPGCVRGFREEADIPDFITKGKLDYRTLVQWVTDDCPACLEDPCIPLANVHLDVDDEGHTCHPLEIDIGVRPIVFTNDLLFELMWSLLTDKPAAARRRK